MTTDNPTNKMTGAALAQLIITLGPVALELAPKIAALWTKEMTAEELTALCAPAKKSHDQYILEARTRLTGIMPPTPLRQSHTGDA